MKAAGMPNERSWMKGHEIQRGIVQCLARFRIAGEKNLKSAIQLKAFYAICAGTPTDAVGSLKDCAGEASFLQATRTGQSGKTGTDNEHLWSGVFHVTITLRQEPLSQSVINGM
jgi:hypothetical protein